MGAVEWHRQLDWTDFYPAKWMRDLVFFSSALAVGDVGDSPSSQPLIARPCVLGDRRASATDRLDRGRVFSGWQQWRSLRHQPNKTLQGSHPRDPDRS